MMSQMLDESQAEIQIVRRNINNLRYADDTTLIPESEEELKSLLMKVKEESEKSDLKLGIQKSKTMASGPLTSWHIEGEKVEAMTDFILLGSKITANGGCSHEIQRRLLLERKTVMKPTQHIKKQRYHFAYKGPGSQNYCLSSSHSWMCELVHKEG